VIKGDDEGGLTKVKPREALLSVPQFGVTPACIRRWLLERRIASVKIGRLRKIPESEADRLIAEGFCPAKLREVRLR
jgi:hypothetical protein